MKDSKGVTIDQWDTLISPESRRKAVVAAVRNGDAYLCDLVTGQRFRLSQADIDRSPWVFHASGYAARAVKRLAVWAIRLALLGWSLFLLTLGAVAGRAMGWW